MSFDAVRAAAFDTINAELAPLVPGVPIHFENQKFNQPNGPWIYVAAIPGDSFRSEISSARRYRHFGVINVKVMVPQDAGTKKLNEVTQAAFTVLADRNWNLVGGGRMTTSCCKRRNQGLLNGFLTYNLQVEYRHDERMGESG